jgi:hypothetical protein
MPSFQTGRPKTALTRFAPVNNSRIVSCTY